jgi:hypothetical protein
MKFWCSQWKIWGCLLKNIKKKLFFSYRVARLLSRPMAEAGLAHPARSPAPAPARPRRPDRGQGSPAAWPPLAGDSVWVASCGPHWAMPLHNAPSRCSLSFHPQRASSSREHARTRLRHRLHARLAGVGRSGHHRSPPATTSRSEHWLHLAHPMLASACRGKAPARGNCSIFSYPCAHFLRLGSPVLEHHFPCRLLAGDGRPPCASAATPPLPPVSPYRCSLGSVSWCAWIASLRGARWCSPRGRRPHRRRVLAPLVISPLSVCMTGGVRGPLSAAGVCAWVQIRVDLAISLADLKRI